LLAVARDEAVNARASSPPPRDPGGHKAVAPLRTRKLPQRHNLVLLLLSMAIGATLVWYFHPDRSLARAWQDLVSSVEARNSLALRSLLADDYSDRWGYDRDTLVLEARLAFRNFERLRVTATEVEVRRRGDTATLKAIIRIEAEGTPSVADARAAVNGLFSPFEFSFRREPGFPWSWKLTGFDQPEFHLERYRRARQGF
jgi:hypothetical protein